jgi:tetratricopeptide (TPR) repeat protein
MLDASTLQVSTGNAALASPPPNLARPPAANSNDAGIALELAPSPSARVQPSANHGYGDIDLPGLPETHDDLPGLRETKPAAPSFPDFQSVSLDLPTPRSAPAPAPAAKKAGFSVADDDLPGLPSVGELDLPTPSRRNSLAMDDLPVPAIDFDLPTPVQTDFGRGNADIDLPMPSHNDLPMPTLGPDLPMPSLELPTPAYGDLPIPSHGDLPLPSLGSLPQPAQDLLSPHGDNLLPNAREASQLPQARAASNLPSSAAAPDAMKPQGKRPSPPRAAARRAPPPPPPPSASSTAGKAAASGLAESLRGLPPLPGENELELDSLPAIEDLDLDLDLGGGGTVAPSLAVKTEPRNAAESEHKLPKIELDRPQPSPAFDPAAESLAQASIPKPQAERFVAAPTPTPRREAQAKRSHRSVPKPVIYAGSAIALLTIGGFLGFALLPDNESTPTETRAQRPTKTESQVAAATTSPEQIEKWKAALDRDDAGGYREAAALASASGDSIRKAEADLLFHQRLGPDPALVASARQALARVKGNELPQVRALALLDLVDSRPDRAAHRLEGFAKPSQGQANPDALAQLYAAWAARDLGRANEAFELANAALSARPNLVGAQILVAALEVDLQPTTGKLDAKPDAALERMLTLAKAAPNHLAWQIAAIESLVARGRWHDAEQRAAKLVEAAKNGADSTIAHYLLQAKIARLQGNLAQALTRLDGALATHGQAIEPKLARVELLIQLGDMNAAGSEIERLRISAANDVRVLESAARVALARGEGAKAIEYIHALAQADGVLGEAKVPAKAPEVKEEAPRKRRGKSAPSAAPAPAPSDPADQTRELVEGPDNAFARARIHDLRGEWMALKLNVTGATEEFERARQLNPQLIATYATQFDLYERIGQKAKGLKFLQESRAALEQASKGTTPAPGGETKGNEPSGDGDQTPRAAPWQRQGQSLVLRTIAHQSEKSGDLARAKATLNTALAIDNSDNATHLAIARVMLRAGEQEQAQETLIKLFERTRGMPGLTGPLSDALLQRGKLEELSALIGDQLEDPQVSEEILFSGVRLRLAENQPDQALTLVDRALQRRQDSWEGHLYKAQALYAKKEFAPALSELELAQSKDPQASIELWRGKIYLALGKNENALAAFSQTIKLDPEVEEATVAKGLILARSGATREVIALLEPLTKRGGDKHPLAHLAMAIAYKDLLDLDRATQHLRAAVDIDPTLFEAHYLAGRIASDLNRHAAAAAALSRALGQEAFAEDQRQVLDAQRLLGREYEALNRKQEARAAYRQYLDLAPPQDPGRAQVERALRNLR